MQHLLVKFRDAVDGARRLIAAAHIADQNGNQLWPEPDRSFVVEAAFLKIFIGWEHFQESAFVHLMLGGASESGNIVPRFVTPTDSTHAGAMLVGTTRYVDWSTPDPVRKLSRLYFVNGHPFETVLAAIHSDLTDLKTIRNSTAHLSANTSQQLDALASRKLQRNISNGSASSLLLASDPSSTGGSTILDTYISLLDAAATQIINA